MLTEIVTHWAHVRLTLGVDPDKHIHVLVPCQLDEPIDFVERFASDAFISVIPCIWSCLYRRELSLTSLELIYDRVTPTIIDLIDVVRNSLKEMDDKRIVLLSSDDALMGWLEGGTNRNIKWCNSTQFIHSKQPYMVFTVTEYADGD